MPNPVRSECPYAERLTERIVVQGYDITVLEAVYHVVEHFAGHAGQIIFATKLLTGFRLRSVKSEARATSYPHCGRPKHAPAPH